MTARTRRFFNDRTAVVAEMLEGYAAAHADVIALSDGMVIRAKRKAEGLVGLVVANGSGHEPAMIGWVGQGLLDVNVPGPVFSSPGPGRILTGLREADRGAGVLLLVSSHAGDIMNASVAMADAEALGRNVAMVVLYDDIASAPGTVLRSGEVGPGSSSSGRSSEGSRSGVRDWMTARRWRGACATVRDRSPPRSGR